MSVQTDSWTLLVLPYTKHFIDTISFLLQSNHPQVRTVHILEVRNLTPCSSVCHGGVHFIPPAASRQREVRSKERVIFGLARTEQTGRATESRDSLRYTGPVQGGKAEAAA